MLSAQASLLEVRPDEPLTYVPKFTKDEVLLGFKEHISKKGGFKFIESYPGEGDEEVRSQSVTIPLIDESPSSESQGFMIRSSTYYCDASRHFTVARIVNGWFANKANKYAHPQVWKWLVKNAEQISRDNRYWVLREKIDERASLEQDVRDLQEKIRVLQIQININTLEVQQGVTISGDQRRVLALEFGATEEDLK